MCVAQQRFQRGDCEAFADVKGELIDESTPFRSVPPDRLTFCFLASSATKRLATELCDVVGAWPRHCTSGPGTEKHELHKSTVYPLDLMSGCWRRVVHVTRPNLFIGGMN
jgi:hypothetical protein